MHLKSYALGFLTAFAVTVVVACTTVRTVYVPPQVPVQLREDIPDVKIWVFGEDGEKLPSTITAKAGWFMLSDEK